MQEVNQNHFVLVKDDAARQHLCHRAALRRSRKARKRILGDAQAPLPQRPSSPLPQTNPTAPLLRAGRIVTSNARTDLLAAPINALFH